jgi:hypothetical protein
MNVEDTSKENGVSAMSVMVWVKYKRMRSKHDQQAKTNKFRQQQDEMDWVVRHCSPNTVIHHPVDDDRHGHQSDPFGFSDWCAPVDWRCVRLKDTD